MEEIWYLMKKEVEIDNKLHNYIWKYQAYVETTETFKENK